MPSMASRPIDILCVGILIADYCASPVDAFPERGTSLFVESLDVRYGGCAYNTGVVAARLGSQVEVVGCIGRDANGKALKESLEDQGVGVSGIRDISEYPTSLSFVLIPTDGQRRIYTYPGANQALTDQDIPDSLLSKTKLIHIGGAGMMAALDGEATVRLLSRAKEHGVLTSMDPVYRPERAMDIRNCLSRLDIFLPNADESIGITGHRNPAEQLEFYLSHGVRLAGIKMGEHGARIGTGSQRIRAGIHSVPVVDTCGAGDAFIAGFLHGYLHDSSLDECLALASATAAHCVQAVGSTKGVPDLETIRTFMKERGSVVVN